MNLNDFEHHISPEIADRGYDYFMNDHVDELENTTPGMWIAEVHGSDTYTVEVKTNQSDIKSWDCDCPYDYGLVCKHVVAVLHAITNQIKSDEHPKPNKKKKKTTADKIREIGGKVSKEDLWEFIHLLFNTDRNIKNRLTAHFAELLDEDSSLKYKTIIRNYYKAAQDRYGFVDYRSAPRLTRSLYELTDKAAELLAKGNKPESLEICKSLIEEMPDISYNMDDSDGGVGDIMYMAFDILAQLVGTASPILKDELFDYILKEFPKEKYYDFGYQDHFLMLLPALVSSPAQENQFMELISHQIEVEKSKPHYSFRVTRLIKTQVEYYLLQNREKEALALIELHKDLADFREMLIDRAITERNFEQAKILCNEGIKNAEKEHFPSSTLQWESKLYEIARAEGDRAEQRIRAENLFFDNHYSMEWYGELKSIWPKEEWADKCESLIGQINEKGQGSWYGVSESLARIFVKEGYRIRLLKLLQSKSGSIEFTDRYCDKLIPDYPEEVLDMYETGLNEEIKKTGRKEYRKIVRYLKIMRNIRGGDERVYALLNQFLLEYKNRPAMADEFKKAFPEWLNF